MVAAACFRNIANFFTARTLTSSAHGIPDEARAHLEQIMRRLCTAAIWRANAFIIGLPSGQSLSLSVRAMVRRARIEPVCTRAE